MEGRDDKGEFRNHYILFLSLSLFFFFHVA